MKNLKSNSLSRLFKLNLILIPAIALFAVSCEKDDTIEMSQPNISQMSIAEVLESYSDMNSADESELKRGKSGKPKFSTLSVALARTGLAGTVSSNQLTVFAPTDAAFAELGLYPNNIASVPNLKEILLYHVVAGKVFSTDLSNGFVPTLNGAAVEIDLSSGVMVNDANVIKADIKARNGVIHAIDKILFPPTQNLVELAQSFAPEFTILVEAAIKADLAGVLANGGPYTVFAPTNQAFMDFLGEFGFSGLDDIPVEILQKVLLYHVVEGRVFSSDLTSGEVTTASGKTFDVNTSNFTITDDLDRVSEIDTDRINIQAANGVIHVIEKVIFPELP